MANEKSSGLKPRRERILHQTAGIQAASWSYADPTSIDVVVEVWESPRPRYIGTVTVRVRGTRRRRVKRKAEA